MWRAQLKSLAAAHSRLAEWTTMPALTPRTALAAGLVELMVWCILLCLLLLPVNTTDASKISFRPGEDMHSRHSATQEIRNKSTSQHAQSAVESG